MRILFVMLVSALMLASRTRCAFAGDGHAGELLRTQQVVGSQKISKPWNDIVGSQVVAEGLGWGAFNKGLGQHLILDGAKVYVRNIDFLKDRLNGTLIRVVGTLRKGRVSKVPSGDPGYTKDFDYFYIDIDHYESIDRVTSPWLREVVR